MAINIAIAREPAFHDPWHCVPSVVDAGGNRETLPERTGGRVAA